MRGKDASIGREDLDECWCCGGLHDSLGALCADCDDAGCKHFGGECQSDHKPVVADGGRAEHDSGVARGAVLYDVRDSERRPCCSRGGRCLAHVTGVYEERSHGEVYYQVWDGTHTTREWVHEDDLLALYEPAGWSWPTSLKPTYHLTRQCGVEDHHDLMTDGGQAEEVDQEPPKLGDVMDYPGDQRGDDRRWLVLYEEDYDNFGVDPEGNLAVLVDIEQTGEILRLASQTLASLSYKDAEPDEPIRDMIEALEDVVDDE